MRDTTLFPWSRRLIVLVVLTVVASAALAADLQPPEGFVALFDGKSLAGWNSVPNYFFEMDKRTEAERKELIARWTEDAKKHWKVDNGELVNDGNGANLTTDKEYGDIELLMEYKTVPLADSGIFLRATPQVQIWDDTKEGGKGSGGLSANSPDAPGKDPLVLADKPFGQWNKFRIVQVGERVSVWLNEKLVVDHARLENFWNHDLPLLKKGPIQLQNHRGEIRWRNIFLREIPSEEANEILRKHNAAGFVDLFNGKDFTGWAGPVDQYEVKEGAIVCRPKRGGTIYAKDQYSDFVARVEYRLPPGGNNGLAIRYPGKGDSAYVGMCEIQVLDDDAPQYARLDPRQYNGSVYGQVAVHRGYLRKTGEWNLMEVAVRGPTIRVELNGTRVLDADVSKVTSFMANSPHPGKDRTSGYFGLCGHSDTVAFRKIQVKPLESKTEK